MLDHQSSIVEGAVFATPRTRRGILLQASPSSSVVANERRWFILGRTCANAKGGRGVNCSRTIYQYTISLPARFVTP